MFCDRALALPSSICSPFARLPAEKSRLMRCDRYFSIALNGDWSGDGAMPQGLIMQVERIRQLCSAIQKETDMSKLQSLIKEFRALLAEEQAKLEAKLEKGPNEEYQQ
jgi:hypothetical protein